MFRNGKYKLSLLFVMIPLYFQPHNGVSVVLLTHTESQSVDFCCFSHEFTLSLLFFFFAPCQRKSFYPKSFRPSFATFDFSCGRFYSFVYRFSIFIFIINRFVLFIQFFCLRHRELFVLLLLCSIMCYHFTRCA